MSDFIAIGLLVILVMATCTRDGFNVKINDQVYHLRIETVKQ